ncbi:MAG TPA: tripartite tricarboxylate transporter substrate binding protein [Xanthobacteraceae bacterium]|nr:tripartite tricarboxylate transporter substrate binding protein [Xanthobacteraceae bacterium]
MRPLSRAIAAALAALGAAFTGHAAAQTYPDRTVEIINPYTPGGATDIMGRALMDGLAEALKQRFVFVNRPGANGAIGTAAVARANPDGYTLLFTAAVSMVVNPLTQKETGYTLDSFDHICQTLSNEMVLEVHPDSPFKTAGDLIAAAKAKPGGLNYAILGIGSIPHLATIELEQVAGVKFNAVPFKGDSEVIQQVHGRHVDFGASTLAGAAKSGLRLLGVFSKQRNPAIPDVPTFRELGYDVAPASIGGLSAPKGLPADVKAKLEEACRAAAHSERYRAVAKAVFQPSEYYAGSAEYTKALQEDLAVKRRLLGQLGMVREAR